MNYYRRLLLLWVLVGAGLCAHGVSSQQTIGNTTQEDLSWQEEYSFLMDYNVKLISCKQNEWMRNPETGEYEYGAVVYRLCPSDHCNNSDSGGCADGYGDFVVGINTYVQAYFEDQRDNMYYDDNFRVPDYAECRRYEREEEAGDYYLGPACTNDAKDIRLAIFTDGACTKMETEVTFEEISMGWSLPYEEGGLVSTNCQFCSQYDAIGEDVLSEMCLDLYENSGKCETLMETYHFYGKQEGSCGYINSLIADESASPSPPEEDCKLLPSERPYELEVVLSKQGGVTCIRTPSAAQEGGFYRLTLVPNQDGRYEISHATSMFEGIGYAWSSPADGIYYCVPADTDVSFDDYVDESTVQITVKSMAPGEDCRSDIIGYNGYKPVEPPKVPADGAAWSAPRYFLKADYFAYQVAGEEEVVSLENATSIDIGGDPGTPYYQTIEVTWYLDGREKRFIGYIEANATHWNMFQAIIYNANRDWESVRRLSGVLAGKLGECLYEDELVLANDRGSEIRFGGLVLATFLPWDKTETPSVLQARSSSSVAQDICPLTSATGQNVATGGGMEGQGTQLESSSLSVVWSLDALLASFLALVMCF